MSAWTNGMGERHRLVWGLLLGLGLSCGTLVESTGTGSTRKDGGLSCVETEPCSCARCTDTEECAEGLSCLQINKRGPCQGQLTVCTTPEAARGG